MHQYRQASPQLVNVSNSPVNPVPHPGGRAPPPPTRYKVKCSAYETKSLLQEFTVEVEYRKYASGKLCSLQTDILKFWEVSEVHVIVWRNDSHPNRLIKPSTQHSL